MARKQLHNKAENTTIKHLGRSKWPSRIVRFTLLSVIIAGCGAGVYSVFTRHNSSVGVSEATTAIPIPVAPPAGMQWGLKFNDDFEGTAVDRTKWNIREDINYGFTHGQDQCYRAKNATVSGGYLYMRAIKEKVTCAKPNPDRTDSTYFWTSAFLTTEQYRWGSPVNVPMTYEFKHGYIEARLKVPVGNPWWSSFWLVGSGTDGPKDITQSGEFDIEEIFSMAPDSASTTMHYEGDNCTNRHCMSKMNIYSFTKESQDRSPYTVADGYDSNGLPFDKDGAGTTWRTLYVGATQSDFHRYGLYWDSNGLRWYIDGRISKSVTADGIETLYYKDGRVRQTNQLPVGNPSIAQVLQYSHAIHLNLAIGGRTPQNFGYTGSDAGATDTYTDGNLWYDPANSATLVDYVKVYQLESTSPVPADLNNDGKVDVYDLTALTGKWNTADAAADLSKDGIVNVFDLSILLSRWTG